MNMHTRKHHLIANLVSVTRLHNLVIGTLLVIVGWTSNSSASPNTNDLWDQYDKILKQYVVGNRVDYEGLSTSGSFKEFMQALRQHPSPFGQGSKYLTLGATPTVEQLHAIAEPQKQRAIAFFINSYNALTLELVAGRIPLESIKDIGGWCSSPWKIALFEHNGQLISLDEIEHKILRNLNEPRIHFAINCASISCPLLRGEAYRAERLNAQLSEQQAQFINSSSGVQINQGKARISKIFDWFEEDWGSKGKILQLLCETHENGSAIERISGYLPYNWGLNEAK